MTNSPPPMYPPDYGQDQNNNVNHVSSEIKRSQKRMAAASMVCGVAGLLLCLGALAWIIVLRGEYNTLVSLGKITNLFERVLVYGLGMTLGGVLSLLGFVLALNAIDTKLALYAIFVSILGPLCMAGWFLALFF